MRDRLTKLASVLLLAATLSSCCATKSRPLVPVNHILRGTIIRAGDLRKSTDCATGRGPDGWPWVTDPSQVVGYVANVSLLPGEPFTIIEVSHVDE